MKKILYAILPIMLAFALAAGVAFSAWQLESNDISSDTLASRRDDIFENYDIKVANETQVNRVKTYEMYLYPSTLYLNDYLDYLSGTSTVKPEDKYGYIEPVVAQNGAVTYNVVNKQQDVNGDNAYLKDVAANTTSTMSNDNFTAGMYYNVYKGNSTWTAKDTDSVLKGSTVAVGSQKNVDADFKFLYGDPELDVYEEVTYSDSTTGVTMQDTSGERHGWRNLHYYDRFGYWPTLAKESGRYLPIKITVDENFSNTYYDDVAMSPFSDMGDPHDWYVYTFSCWAYVAYDTNEKKYTSPYYATDGFASSNSGTKYVNSDGSKNPSLGSFCPTMVSQYFDIIESFEKYADKNGVIRLFPKFSNGKGYSSNSINNGGGDAIKVVPTLKNVSTMSPLDQHEMYMFYMTESGTVSDGTNSVPVNVSVLPNIDIDNYDDLGFMASVVRSSAGWQSWDSVYSFDRKTSSGGTNKNITQTLQSYGYGLYNLYLFITDVGQNSTNSDLTGALETLRQNLVKKDSSLQASFPSLFGKNLLPIASVHLSTTVYSTSVSKSFMLVAEKVREAKFIGDVNFGGTNNTTEQEMQDRYLSTDKSFRLINKDLYGIPKNSTTESIINSQFPYCYILQDVDFTEATTQYCQIRFQRAYRSDLHFAETSEYVYERIKFSDQVYLQGFGNYFELTNVAVDGNDQQVIKLINEEMRGVYDIILVFRSAREGTTGTTDRAYNIGLFAYRHTNIFLKIYDGDLTDTVNYYQTNDGAVKGSGTGTAYEFIDHSSKAALFETSYPIGVSVKSTDKDVTGNTIAECVNKTVQQKGGVPTNYKLYDHVTKAEVAHYEERGSTELKADVDYLEYGGKFYELVFNQFKIRKNYIFYIA